jgi:hypothetical protein
MTERMYTPEEVSQQFRVPIEAIKQEIASGRLSTITVVGSFVRIPESAIEAFKRKASGQLSAGTSESLQVAAAPAFSHKWPDGKIEQFIDVREGIASYTGREYHVKLGFTVRKSAGKRRLRCLVIVERYPTVEFVAADESPKGKMVSIIKDRKGKQIPVGSTVPPEYHDLSVGPYRDIVIGSGAPNGLSVVCEGNDLETMVKHALIRYNFRSDRSRK